jgi:hypothetical protein
MRARDSLPLLPKVEQWGLLHRLQQAKELDPK